MLTLRLVVALVFVVGRADHRRAVADLLVPADRPLEPHGEPIERGVAGVDLDGGRPRRIAGRLGEDQRRLPSPT